MNMLKIHFFFNFSIRDNWDSISYKIIHPRYYYDYYYITKLHPTGKKNTFNHYYHLPFQRVYQHRSLNKVSNFPPGASATPRVHTHRFDEHFLPWVKSWRFTSTSRSGGWVTWYRASDVRTMGNGLKEARQPRNETPVEKEKAGKPHGSRG